MIRIRDAFTNCRREERPALITYVTAGYPSPNATTDILLGMERGGVDIVELGMPFTDPIADGPTIQRANTVALGHGTTLNDCLEMVRTSRERGLTIPVLLMGYYNPVLSFGESRLMKQAKEVGVNGFIIVDLPPEEAVSFRKHCLAEGLSFVPLVAPATSNSRLKSLCKVADEFIYVVSRMGVTGASATINSELPALLERVRQEAQGIPIAVGFGISDQQQFSSVGKLADGVVIGSKIIDVISAAPVGEIALAVERFCAGISGLEKHGLRNEVTDKSGERRTQNSKDSIPIEAMRISNRSASIEKDKQSSEHVTSNDSESPPDPSHKFGEFGGQYVPESLMDCLAELETGFKKANADPRFWEEYRSYYSYMGRPSNLHMAERLSEHAGGAQIWLKREDLNHTGSHKINNALGQILLARRLGKTEIIAETGAGQHGVATATVCAKFGMKCTVYMGAEDVRRQALNVFRMKLLGAEVIPVEAGSRTLRDAVNEALRAWVTRLSTTHYIIGSAIGPHPYPTIVRTFQSVIGKEMKEQMKVKCGRLPDAVVACVGGGSNAVGTFHSFVEDNSVRLLGVEAGGDGIGTGRHSATLTAGSKGVLHGVRTYVLQDANGQILDTHSVSAGLDYPGVGPELSAWKDSDRVKFVAATDSEALEGFRLLSQLEGIIPALETSHAVYKAVELAKSMPKDNNVVICISGRGDKDVQQIADELPRLGPLIGWDLRFGLI